MKFNSLKIKSKMQVSFITAVIIVMVGTAFFTFQLMKKSITQNLKSSLEVLSHIAVDAVTSGLEFNDSEEIASAAKTFTNQDIVSYISVRDNTGNEVFQYRKQGLSDLQDRENIEKISDEMFTKAFVKSEGKQIGAVTIGISLKERNKVLASSNIITAILLLAVVAILLVVTNFIANMISKPINEITVIAEEMARGKLNQEISIQGEDEIGRLAGSFRDMLQTLLAKADAAEQISQGNINVDIQVASDEDILGKAMVMIKKSLKTLQEELSSTIDAQKAGDIDARTQPAKLQGAYSELSSGVNEVLESIILPLLEVVDILKEYANGDLHREMRELPGKQIVLTNSINDIRNNLIFLVEEAKMLADSALEGDLNNRGDVDKFFGDYGKLVQGINDILNAVVKPVKEIIDGIDRIANKDLTTRMTSEYKGDFDKLKQNFNVSMQNLDEALLQVAEVTEQISSTSNQISSGSQNLAEGANEQASSLEEVSSSLEEMSAMTQQNADNASQARNMSKDTRQSAENGNKAMEKMKDAINKIKTSSDETAKIVKTIDEIAFQTNLLALNAAVEAARAGDAGKGFAVVAEEVRNLAQRSAEAAKNTAEMIEESVNNANTGVKISGEVATALDEVVNSIGKVNDLIGEIAAASKEQAEGIEQVNTAVAQMNKVTQQNAANSEESASASEELNGQAEELNALVGEFKLSTDGSLKKKRVAGVRQRQIYGKASAQPAPIKGKKKVTKVVKPEIVIPLDDDELSNF